jgi:hypothetical protein
MTRSEAAIDPERGSADLVVEFASGPAFHFGEFKISGLQKYDASLVRTSVHHARRAVQRRRVEPVRATTQRIGLLRERAGEDRYGGAESRRCNGRHLGARGPPKRFEGGVGYSTDVHFLTNAITAM